MVHDSDHYPWMVAFLDPEQKMIRIIGGGRCMVQIVINYNGRMKYFNVPYGVARAVDVLIHDKSFDPEADDELDKLIAKDRRKESKGLTADLMIIDEEVEDEKKIKKGSSSHHGPLHDLSRINSV